MAREVLLTANEIMEVATLYLIEVEKVEGVKSAIPFNYREGDEIISLAGLDKNNNIIYNEDVDLDDIVEYITSRKKAKEKAEEIAKLQAKAAVDRATKDRERAIRYSSYRDEEYEEEYKPKKKSSGIEINLPDLKGLGKLSIKEKLIGGILIASVGFNMVQLVNAKSNEELMTEAAKTIQALKSEGANTENVNQEQEGEGK